MLPAFRLFWRTAATPMHVFADKFQDPLLRRAFRNIFFQDPEGFPLLPYLFNMAAAHHLNAGFPQGGSLGLSRSVENRYLGLGGEVTYRARTEKILVENDRAIGIELRNGRRYFAEHIVSACDGRTTVHGLLDGRYTSPGSTSSTTTSSNAPAPSSPRSSPPSSDCAATSTPVRPTAPPTS